MGSVKHALRCHGDWYSGDLVSVAPTQYTSQVIWYCAIMFPRDRTFTAELACSNQLSYELLPEESVLASSCIDVVREGTVSSIVAVANNDTVPPTQGPKNLDVGSLSQKYRSCIKVLPTAVHLIYVCYVAMDLIACLLKWLGRQ